MILSLDFLILKSLNLNFIRMDVRDLWNRGKYSLCIVQLKTLKNNELVLPHKNVFIRYCDQNIGV